MISPTLVRAFQSFQSFRFFSTQRTAPSLQGSYIKTLENLISEKNLEKADQLSQRLKTMKIPVPQHILDAIAGKEPPAPPPTPQADDILELLSQKPPVSPSSASSAPVSTVSEPPKTQNTLKQPQPQPPPSTFQHQSATTKQVPNRPWKDSPPHYKTQKSFSNNRPPTFSEYSPMKYAKSNPKAHTFTSSHFRMDPRAITQYLDRKNLKYKSSGEEFVLQFCPFACSHHKNKSDNMWKVYIHKYSGAWICHRCGSSGSWFDFLERLGDSGSRSSFSNRHQPFYSGIQEESTDSIFDPSLKVNPNDSAETGSSSKPSKTLSFKSIQRYMDNLSQDSESAPIVQYLCKDRAIPPNVLQEYHVGVGQFRFKNAEGWDQHHCLVFPWLQHDSSSSELVVDRIKIRALENKANQRLIPQTSDGGRWGFFGWHLVKPTDQQIILTEGEFDAMAVRSVIKDIPVVSLPNGANSLNLSLLPQLEQFHKIYLWMDDDAVGQEGAESIAKKLGIQRCLLVHSCFPESKPIKGHLPKDANEALLAGYDLRQLFHQAAPIQHQQIVSFSEMKPFVLREIHHHDQVVGNPILSLPSLTKIIKGHRKGELTIYTGPTGVGKTSILSQISLDLALQGTPTLWGSFEIPNVRLAKKMLVQYVHHPETSSSPDNLNQAAHEFDNLPFHFLKFFGSTNVDQVLDALEYAVYVHNVKHFILDNLQFMTSGQGRGLEKFDLMDSAIEKFRRFATEKNIHISLVVHPRKELEGNLLTISSVFGTAKATQEADTVIIVQKSPENDQRFLHVVKNRFDGTLGKAPFTFDPVSTRIIDPNYTRPVNEKVIPSIGSKNTDHIEIRSSQPPLKQPLKQPQSQNQNQSQNKTHQQPILPPKPPLQPLHKLKEQHELKTGSMYSTAVSSSPSKKQSATPKRQPQSYSPPQLNPPENRNLEQNKDIFSAWNPKTKPMQQRNSKVKSPPLASESN